MSSRAAVRSAVVAVLASAAVFGVRQAGDEPFFALGLALVASLPVVGALLLVRPDNRLLRRILLAAAWLLAGTWALLSLRSLDCVDCGFAVLLALQQTVVHLGLVVAALVDRWASRRR